MNDDFCRSCGADVPPREGEGTCPECACHDNIPYTAASDYVDLLLELVETWANLEMLEGTDGYPARGTGFDALDEATQDCILHERGLLP